MSQSGSSVDQVIIALPLHVCVLTVYSDQYTGNAENKALAFV